MLCAIKPRLMKEHGHPTCQAYHEPHALGRLAPVLVIVVLIPFVVAVVVIVVFECKVTRRYRR